MKHIKLFENFEDGDINIFSEDIESICKELGIENWTLNGDGTVDVDGHVNLYNKGLFEQLPLKFGEVTGSFRCDSNHIASLEGCPSIVGGDFNCSDNRLETLEGISIEVGGNFNCSHNKLDSLKSGPISVGGCFNCSYNELTKLEGAHIKVNRRFTCYKNYLINLEGIPDVGGDFDCEGNQIFEVYKLFPNHKSFMESLDYDYLRGTNIIKWKFKEALDEFDIKLPESLRQYKYI